MGKVFRVREDTGDVYAFERLDREKIPEYHLTALVVDKNTNQNLESPSSFTIKVHDVNDNWPVFTHRLFNASVPEMSAVGMCQHSAPVQAPQTTTQPFLPPRAWGSWVKGTAWAPPVLIWNGARGQQSQGSNPRILFPQGPPSSV